MKKLTINEMMGSLPSAPVEGTTGPEVTQLPRQCPVCDARFYVSAPQPVRAPIMRFEMCPDCLAKDCPGVTSDLEEQTPDSLPELNRPTADDYWND